MLRKIFGVELEELIPGIERKLGSKILGVRGSADLLFANVIFEVKVNLRRELDDAKRKLRKYFQALYEREPEKKYVGIATDIIVFKAYTPLIKNGRVVDVSEIGSIDISKVSVTEAVLWLDSFIFSKPRIRPTAEDLKWRFGPSSPTYAIAVDELRALWSEVEDQSDVKLKLNLWARSMEIVYGSKPKLISFIDHTYLVTLVKLIVYLRLSGDNIVRESRIRRALTGEYFASYGILNLIEEDFFTWILHPKIVDRALKLICNIAKELLRYDLSQVDEDFFKEIYQEIVERGQRHRIGEYYTPEWLTELILKEVMSLWKEKSVRPPRILDPACGSGTFLCNAIHMLKEELSISGWSPERILDFILSNIVGVDINPLAVTIARANYLIALGDLLYLGKPITIPIYVADSIKLPKVTRTLLEDINTYEYKVDDVSIQMPIEIAKDRGRLSHIIEGFKEAINSYRIRRSKDEAYGVFERMLSTITTADELRVLKSTLNAILTLIDEGLDAIWIFMLSNIYVPVALKESKFDVVIGNPPWIAMRYVENKDYQDYLKGQVFFYNLLSRDQIHQFSNMEIATLFFRRTSDLYLKEGGIIGFVMPRSVITGALHHLNFKSFDKPKMKLVKILDLENVTPLFNVPSCVLIAVKDGVTEYPVLTRRYSGRLREKNVRLEKAIKQLSVSDYLYKPPLPPLEESKYYSKIKKGADLHPRSVCFIDFDVRPGLGIDSTKPLVKSAEDALKKAKDRWKNVELRGNVESNFIYVTLLGGDIVPFGHTDFRPVVLPIEQQRTNFKLLDVPDLRSRGFKYMANWLESAQRMWEERATERSLANYPRIVLWFDHMNKLTNQNPSKRYVVLYNATGTNIASCVIDRYTLPSFQLLRAKIRPKNFVVYEDVFFYETNDEMEAHYLCSILNSNIVNEAIKPFQSRGAFGERTITRLPFKLPVPLFDRGNPIHVKLAKLSKKCHAKVASLRFTKKSVAGRRKEARTTIKEELKEIDKLVSELLGIRGD